MDPLSVIASVIAITQGLDAGINTLRGLANASAEFCQMLNELSTLQGWLSQLHAVVDGINGPKSRVATVSADAVRRLEELRTELGLVVDEMNDVIAKLLARGPRMPIRRGGRKISRIDWQLMRGKVIKLRDRARHCREDLSTCLDLLGFSQQLHHGRITMEIREIVESSSGGLDQRLDSILSVSQDQHSLIRSMSARIDARLNKLETRLSMVASDQPNTSSPPAYTPSAAEDETSVVHMNASVRQACNRYCKCQCHVTSTVYSPSWTRSLIGSLVVQYNGAAIFGVSPCNVYSCRSGGKTSVNIGYAFPRWLLSRAISISAGWGSLTNAGASLHLVVPRVAYVPGLWGAVLHRDFDWLRKKITNREFLPTDIQDTGEGILGHVIRFRHFDVAAFLIEMGFSPTFIDSNGGSALSQVKMQLRLYRGLSPRTHQFLLRVVAAAGEDSTEISTVIQDSILGINKIPLEDALAMEPSHINKLDDVGYAPLHWAARRNDLDKVKTLIEHGATVDIKAGRNSKTPLHLAVHSSSSRVIRFLLDSGANIHARDFRGYTPLHCGIGNVTSVRTLLRAGANPNLRADGGTAPIHLTPTTNYEVMVDTIASVATPDDVNHKPPNQHPLLPPESPLVDKDMRSYLSNCPDLAARLAPTNTGCGEVVNELVAGGADRDATNDGGMTAMMSAAAIGNTAALWALCRAGARPDVTNRSDSTFLDYSAVYGVLEEFACLRALRVRGVNPDAGRAGGYTPFDLFRSRMDAPWLPGQRRPTQGEAFAFVALLVEIRRRNWEAGLFLESRERVLGRDGADAWQRRWLGWQWQRLRDDALFHLLVWDNTYDTWDYGAPDYREDRAVDYDTSVLFDIAPGDAMRLGGAGFVDEKDDGDSDDVFFDALE